MLPKTLTEAASLSGPGVFRLGAQSLTVSNARSVPYAEVYREQTALTETPVQRIQRAALDEARRRSEKDAPAT